MWCDADHRGIPRSNTGPRTKKAGDSVLESEELLRLTVISVCPPGGERSAVWLEFNTSGSPARDLTLLYRGIQRLLSLFRGCIPSVFLPGASFL